MKTSGPLALLLLLLTISTTGCRKKKNDPPKAEHFYVKTITSTFPVLSTPRSVDITYTPDNKIGQLIFQISGLVFTNTYEYNQNQLLIKGTRLTTHVASGIRSERIYRFNYAADKLSEITVESDPLPITYNAAANSYQYRTTVYDLDENNLLAKIDFGTTNDYTFRYLSSSGVFARNQGAIAELIYTNEMLRSSIDTYSALIDMYIMSSSELSSYTNRGTTFNLSSIRDAEGNIVQTDIKNSVGTLVYRYVYTYESRVDK